MAKLVKVRILKPIGTHTPGQVIDVKPELAEQLCAVRKMNNGHGVVEVRNAITQEEFDAALKAPLDMNGLSQGDLAAMGVKNVVATPPDPAADEALAKRAKMAAEAAAVAEAKAKAEMDALAEQSVNQEQLGEEPALEEPPADEAPPADDAPPAGEQEVPSEKPAEEKPRGRNKKSA